MRRLGGNVYVADSYNDRIQVFGSTGAFPVKFEPSSSGVGIGFRGAR